MEAAADLGGQIEVKLDKILISMVWGFQNGVKRPDRITDDEATTWLSFWADNIPVRTEIWSIYGGRSRPLRSN